MRMLKTSNVRELFDALPTSYSKLIYDPEANKSWVQYEGTAGFTCADLAMFIENFNVSDPSECIIAFKRYARDVATFRLPHEMALYEYSVMKGYGLSKSIANVSTGLILQSEGEEQQQCIEYLQMLLK